MKFFDSCDERVTLVDVADDISEDEMFEQYLKMLHELSPEAKEALREDPRKLKEFRRINFEQKISNRREALCGNGNRRRPWF